MMTDAKELLREFVAGGTVLQIGTSSPWGNHCWYAADKDLRLVLVSKETRRHSREFLIDPRVAGSILHEIPIYGPGHGPGEKVRGVYFEGTIERLEREHLDWAFDLYQQRWRDAPALPTLEHIASPDNPDRMWLITPRAFVLFDEVNFDGDPRQELSEW
jgi:uncharacterized protein YhbP (UPF0306 family)